LSTLAIALGVAGCGAGGTAEVSTAAGRPTIAIVLSSAQLSVGKELAAGFTAGAQAAGADVVVTGPPLADPPRQAEMFNEVATRATGGVAIQATDPELISGQLATAAKGGLPVVAVDVKPAVTAGLKTFISNDNRLLGQQIAEEVVKRLPPGSTGTVLVGSTRPGLTVMEERARGIRDGFAAKLPGVKVAGPFDTQSDKAANLAVWKRMTAASPGALAFIGTGTTDSASLAAVHAEKKKGAWLCAGFDLDVKALTGLRDGHLVAIASPEHFLAGAVTGSLQARHAQDPGALPEGWIQTPGLMITSANVSEIIARQKSDADKMAWFKPHLDKVVGDVAAYTKPLSEAG
jgi:ribose transport system substrate-binding protein